MENKTNRSFLTKALRADGIVVVISGLLLVIAAGPLANLIALETPLALVIVGAFLLLYASVILFYAGREPENQQVARLAIALNLLWVVVSYGGLLLGWFPINTAGKWAVALVAEVVLFFAVLEYVGLRRQRGQAGSERPMIIDGAVQEGVDV